MDIQIKEIEDKWRKKWDEMKLYSFSEDERPLYTMDIPPPTISGDLHMGHAFSYPHQDFVARYKRMRGYNVCYQFGFDDNGLATERYTEKKTGRKGKDTPLQEFARLCREQSSAATERMIDVFRRMGISSDFSDYYKTSSPESLKISQSAFLELARKGRAYNSVGPSIRCPTCGTSISQIDLRDKTFRTDFVHIRFGEGSSSIEIATTRPEMLAACVAIFVNPEDRRYAGILGNQVSVPVYGFTVPVMADDYVKMDVGTGAEMVCTFGDQNDMYLWKKHSLDTRIIITPEGKLDDSGGPLSGMPIQQARKAIIEKLSNDGYVLGIEKIEHSVNVHERCDTPIEIGIERQWFIRVLDLVPDLLENGNRINWIPPYMKVRYENWINGLKWDWCISRQRFYGVPFPAWHCEDCGSVFFAEEEELPVDPRTSPPRKCPSCASENTKGDPDVMDTWATSSLSPVLSLSRHSLMEKGYPMDVRFQGHDIISTWAFTTITRSLLHDGSIPWKNILLSGIVSDPTGAKMSKSKGNVTNPEEVLEEYGADPERFWACSSLSWDDIRFKEQEIVRGRRTVIKLYNAAKLLGMLDQSASVNEDSWKAGSKYARWILKKLFALVERITPVMDSYEFSKARTEIDSFFWNTFCDHYLEMLKHLYRSEDGGRREALEAGYFTMLQIAKMYSPVIPFATEEIYSIIPLKGKKKSIHLESWPEPSDITEYAEDESEIDYVVEAVMRIRSEKAKSQQKKGLAASLSGRSGIIKEHAGMLEALTGVTISGISDSEEFRMSIQGINNI